MGLASMLLFPNLTISFGLLLFPAKGRTIHMTIRQIAESLGVAPSTVSVVLNNRPGVRSELRQKIRGALVENGYSIKEPKATQGNILFIYYKSTDYLAARKDDTMTSILGGIEEICGEKHYTFSIANATPDTIDEILMSASPEEYSGIILLGTEYYQTPSDSFFRVSVPLVVLDGFLPEYPLNTVNIDNSYGVHQAVKCLLESGHPKIGYLKSSIEFGCLRDRKNCVYSSLEQLGLTLEPQYVINVSQESEVIQREVEYFLKTSATIPTAFIADNDIIAVSAIQAFQRAGLRVPSDISIIGFDDSNVCTILTPYLTTVKANFNGMAKTATARLIQMINNADENDIIKSTVGTILVERQSVAPNARNQFIIQTKASK